MCDGLVCTNCGLEVQSQIFDDTPEWRSYQDTDAHDAQSMIRADAVMDSALVQKANTKTIRGSWEDVQSVFQQWYPNKDLTHVFQAAKGILMEYLTSGDSDNNSVITIKGDHNRQVFMAAAVYHAAKHVPGGALRANEIAELLSVSVSSSAWTVSRTQGRLTKAIFALQSHMTRQWHAVAANQSRQSSPLETHIKRLVNTSLSIPANQRWDVIKLAKRLADKAKSAMDTIPILANAQTPKLAATLIAIVTTDILHIPSATLAQMAIESHTSKTTMNKLKAALLTFSQTVL